MRTTSISPSTPPYVEKRKKHARESTAHAIGPKMEKLLQGGPEVVFLGTGDAGEVRLNDEAYRYLAQRSIDCKAMPTPEVIEAYNRSKQRKAALIHLNSD